METRASRVQDIFLGIDPRLRARRFAPFAEARVRILFHLDLGEALEDPRIIAFCESIGNRLDLVALEPRGLGESAPTVGAELGTDFRDLVASAARRWSDDLPLIVAGHGRGGVIALSVSDQSAVRGIALLHPRDAGRSSAGWDATQPWNPAELIARCHVPLLALLPRDDPSCSQLFDHWDAQPLMSLVMFSRQCGNALQPPWSQVLADWAEGVATASR